MKSRPTLRDVAKVAKVGVSTVSAILTERPDSWASEQTRKRVFEAAEKLGYYANPLARGLRVNRYQLAVAIFPDITSPFFAFLARALQQALESKGFQLHIEETEMKPEKETQILQDLNRRLIDGVVCVLMDPSFHRAKLDELASRFPVVAAGGMFIDTNIDTLDFDCHQSMSDAVEHLVGLGHTRIGFVDSLSGFCDYNNRLEFFRAAIKKHDLAFPSELWLRCTHGLADIRSAVRDWAKSFSPAKRPTALCCLNDLTAMATIRGLADIGLSVPENISVVGFDDIFLAEYLTCPLSTIRQPADTMAQLAAEILVNRITGKLTGPASHLTISTRFVPRSTTAKVPAEGRSAAKPKSKVQ